MGAGGWVAGFECWVMPRVEDFGGCQAQFSWDPGAEGGGASAITDWSPAGFPCNPAALPVKFQHAILLTRPGSRLWIYR